ncbi:MAG TPA: DinB family protein [Longimicrobiales bacterium]|nr:DinB family protein [Longimicrobiales bacterium]
MSQTVDDLRRILLRDLDTLRAEVEAYGDDGDIWAAPSGIRNTGGTLALHLAGNLHHYVGAVLGGTDYVRDRPGEFGDRDVPRTEILARVSAARDVVDRVLAELPEERLDEPFPVEIAGVTPPTGRFLMHLAVHFGYHLGQLDYHRRFVTGNSDGVGAQGVPILMD